MRKPHRGERLFIHGNIPSLETTIVIYDVNEGLGATACCLVSRYGFLDVRWLWVRLAILPP